MERGGPGRAVHGGNGATLKQLLVEVSGSTGLVTVGPKAQRVTGPVVVAVEDTAQLPDLLRAAERLAALDGAEIVLLLIAARRGAALPDGRRGASRGGGPRGRAHPIRPRSRAARPP